MIQEAHRGAYLSKRASLQNDFAAQGVEVKHPPPGLHVDAIGPVALPALPAQAAALKPRARAHATLILWTQE